MTSSTSNVRYRAYSWMLVFCRANSSHITHVYVGFLVVPHSLLQASPLVFPLRPFNLFFLVDYKSSAVARNPNLGRKTGHLYPSSLSSR
jgi:hypothetical protein